MTAKSARQNVGFTVLEILACLCVGAVLVALSLGGFQKVMGGAKSAKCMSNLRQIGACFSMYLADHDMSFPPTSMENQILVGGAKGSYAGYNANPSTRPLNQYANGDYSIFKCPLDVGYKKNPAREASQPMFKGKTYFSVLGSSYRYNAKDMGRGSLTKIKRAANAEMYKLSQIVKPSRFIVMGDSDAFSLMPGNDPVPWFTNWHGVKKTEGKPARAIATVLFADWHIESIVVTDEPSSANFGDNYHFDVGNQQ